MKQKKHQHLWGLLTVIEPMRLPDNLGYTSGLVVYFCQKCLKKKNESYGAKGGL